MVSKSRQRLVRRRPSFKLNLSALGVLSPSETREPMAVIAYLFASFVGGLLTAVLLWQYGPLAALLAVPFGGSLAVVATVALLFLRSERSPRG